MPEITGTIMAYLSLVGRDRDDPSVLRLLGSSPHFHEGEPFDDRDRGGVWIDIRNGFEGIDVQLRDGIVDRVVLNLQDMHAANAHPRPTEIIDGIDASASSPEDIEHALGAPFRRAAKWSKHRVDDRFVHVAYRNGVAASIVSMTGPR